MALLALAAGELLDRLGSPDPTPGGGSAAALAGAAGAALVAMVCSMPRTRTGEPAERERLEAALGSVREAGGRLRRLVDEDAAAYEAVMAAYRLPKATDEDKSRRREAIAAALAHATEVPLRTAGDCLQVLAAAREAAAHGNPNALSDARTAGALALAGLLGAVENVRINVKADEPAGAAALGRAEEARRRALQAAADLGLL